MNKFKVGDIVILSRFDELDEHIDNNPGWIDNEMSIFVGQRGRITEVANNGMWYMVHNFYWPESALKKSDASALRDAIEKEDKQAEYNRRLERFTEAALTGLCANTSAWSEVITADLGLLAVSIAKGTVSALEKEVKP